MTINHIVAKESHEDGIVSYSMEIFYEGMCKVRYDFVSDNEDEIVKQAESLLSNDIIDYLENIVDIHRENGTIITEYSASLYEKKIAEEMGIH